MTYSVLKPLLPPCQNCSLHALCGRMEDAAYLGGGQGVSDAEVIPCFWTNFTVPSPPMVLLVFILYSIISIIAIVANGLIILLWLR